MLGLPRTSHFPGDLAPGDGCTQAAAGPRVPGRLPGFPEEYRGKPGSLSPSPREEGWRNAHRILRDQLDRAPDKGLLLYIQDLELMDFGDAALAIMEEAWQRVIREEKEKIVFTTPQEYLVREGYLDEREETLYFVGV